MKRTVFSGTLAIIIIFLFVTCDFNDEPTIYTGLPVIYIETENAQTIASKEIWVGFNIKIVSDNPAHNFENSDFRHQIRGRGNATWGYPKKPYRIRFREDTSVFGLTAARNWVLLANWKDATLLNATIAFELGKRFGMPFTNNYIHVDVILNGNYQGSYLFTEHRSVSDASVNIDRNDGYLVEIDVYYDEDPKFRTPKLDLPVMIKFPEFSSNVLDPGYNFVKESLFLFDTLLSDINLPNNNYMESLDIDSFIDYIMINEIVRNQEISHPKSVFMYKDAGEKIAIGPLWDFDWAFGLGSERSVNLSTAKERSLGGWLFSRFFKDPVFVQKYRDRWNEKYNDIITIPAFIDTMYRQLQKSQELNDKRWHFSYPNGRPDNYVYEINKLKTWWINRVEYLNSEINK